MKKKIVVIGAGAWGTAIANLVAINNHEVCAISDIKQIAEEINEKHSHSLALPEIKLNENLRASTDLLSEAKSADFIFIVVPSNVVLTILKQLKTIKLKENCGFIFATKGIEHNSLRFFHEIFHENFVDKNFAILSGPNFAVEVAAKMTTISNVVSENKKFGAEIVESLQNDFFKPIFCQEILATEISAVVKNIIAISCGICEGLNLGENTKAALVVQGIEEIKLLAKKLGAKNPNLENAAGFGDIFLTCSTAKSRNNSLGQALGQGQKYQDLAAKKTYEGAINADSVVKLATKNNLNLKLCQTVDEILKNNFSIDQIKEKIIKIIL